MDAKVRTLFMYISSSGVEFVPQEWRGMSLVMQNQGQVASAYDVVSENCIEVWDIGIDGYKGLPKNVSFDEFQAMASRKAFEKIQGSSRFDIIVAGQTPVAEEVVKMIERLPSKKQPIMVIRFSSYYGMTMKPYQTSTPAGEAGYGFDCEKDYRLLFQLLTYSPLLMAVRSGSEAEITAAIRVFNLDYGEVFPAVIEI